ncbi:hypothetical protein QE152_g37450 [Popillia japonica]|uniref:Ionotropic glutamate receptor L-glutamate and glycine-binding domain-containing protein n=1 Tax=Popillia japonica TaxID=7064 RepID=A0AAW1I9U5_POPJA
MKYPPFVFNNDSGIEMELMKLLSNKLNFTLDIRVGGAYTDWGKRFPNKTWSGRVSEIMNTGIIGIGNVQAAPEIALANKPNRRLPRIIFLSLALYAIVLDAIYQSSLIDILTNPQYEHQISTEEEMLASSLSIGGISSYKDIFDVPSDERSAKIYARYQTVPEEYDTVDYWLRSVSQYKNTCSILGGLYVKYLMASRDPLIMTYNGLPKVYVMRKRLLQYKLRMIMTKGHFLLRPFNRYINQFNISYE